jgi:hypothetical protein
MKLCESEYISRDQPLPLQRGNIGDPDAGGWERRLASYSCPLRFVGMQRGVAMQKQSASLPVRHQPALECGRAIQELEGWSELQ